MNLLPAWRDSLTLFQPKNFKLFFLVTLKTMVDTFKVWIKYFWWLLPVRLFPTILPYLLMPLNEAVRSQILQSIVAVMNLVPNIIYITLPSFSDVVIVTILLAARPSVALKNCAYFRSYFWRALLMAVVLRLPELLGEIILTIYWGQLIASPFIFRLMAVVLQLLKWYIINYVLFFLDSDGSVKGFLRSWIHAAKMILFNFPFYGVVLISYMIWNYANTLLGMYFYGLGDVGAIGMIMQALIFVAVTFFFYCLLINFYIKKLHDQFTLYFGKNE